MTTNNPNIDLSSFGIGVEDIQDEVKKHLSKGKALEESKGLFIVKDGNAWLEQAKQRPIPKMLFSEFWYEGEIGILFADTNLGKSILGVQIGDSISKGVPIKGFKLEAEKQPAIYCDFELSDKQFENRYSREFKDHYTFDGNFLRAEINPDTELPEKQTFEDFLDYSIELLIIETGAKVLIIDNITYLKSENEKAKDALPLMKNLKRLKNKYGLSILALAHTPKRDLSKPITRNDLSGSKMLINFCDSAFSIGESHSDKNLRYIKQIKVRNTENLYDTENVILCQVDKPYSFLEFQFIGFGKEVDHLKVKTEKDDEKLKDKVIELRSIGKSFREIGSELGISHMKARRTLNETSKV
jgi:RecA-family ATPase